MTWQEIGETTLPQARALLAESSFVDGHREVADTIVDVACALTGAKRPNANQSPKKPPSPKPAHDSDTGAVVLDDLAEQLKHLGWIPPMARVPDMPPTEFPKNTDNA